MNTTKELDTTIHEADVVITITNGKIKVLKNRNLMKRSEVIELLEKI